MGVAALALKGLAYQRDAVRLVSHGELWQYASKLEVNLKKSFKIRSLVGFGGLQAPCM